MVLRVSCLLASDANHEVSMLSAPPRRVADAASFLSQANVKLEELVLLPRRMPHRSSARIWSSFLEEVQPEIKDLDKSSYQHAGTAAAAEDAIAIAHNSEVEMLRGQEKVEHAEEKVEDAEEWEDYELSLLTFASVTTLVTAGYCWIQYRKWLGLKKLMADHVHGRAARY
eukprot:TRINITY_DN38342_c0_g1_i2.p1 TRINITY_DN38342_c0_g1~~TRINITY_DN38342_c0_g1_i2.p1  ORF type:complete len:170 (+),score=37.35 TRINITY_DN38342_c0_g1_i2:65-574(+)